MATPLRYALFRSGCSRGKLAEHLAEHFDAAPIQNPVFFYDLQPFRNTELAKSPGRNGGAHHGADPAEGGQHLIRSIIHVNLCEDEVVEAGAFDGARKVLHARAAPANNPDGGS